MIKTFFSNRINLIYLLAFAMPISFYAWVSMLNNFAIDKVLFTGLEIGNLQSIREIPGFLAFLAVYFLLIFSNQNFAIFSLLLLGIGTSLTGIFPTVYGLYFTTIIMSLGFHYLETMQQIFQLNWVDKDKTAIIMGKVISIKSFSMIFTYMALFVAFRVFDIEYIYAYIIFGMLAVVFAIVAFLGFDKFKESTPSHKKLILKKEYWLFYTLTFFAGARRQIFVVFAGFLLVEKYGFSVENIVLLHFVNAIFSTYFARVIGRFISKFGERLSLRLEYIGLAILFLMYGLVDNEIIVTILYVVDHILFAMTIAINSYFKKIADPKDISSSMGVSFTINHIAAVFLPVLLGIVWIYSYKLVFVIGSIIAIFSIFFSFIIPKHPSINNKTVFVNKI
jgi:hypothetical protein